MSSTDATVIGGTEVPPGDAPAIDGVVIERELGRGGMGAVWLGRQSYLDRAVAVKALTLAGDEAFAARFRREARILAGLAHPHIVACHQAGIAPDGRPFLVMEFVDGPDLKRHIAEHGPLPPDEAARLVAEVAEGLRHAFAQGIIHRDVKPENVLLARRPDGDWTAKLADLGLARTSRATAGGSDLTAAGQVLGTPATMAPEQFDDPDAVDHRADIYGLGCVLHHALTGEPAFAGRSFAELVSSKVHGPPPDPLRRRPDLPPALAGLCQRMLDRDREQRPAYDDLIAALRVPLEAPRRRPLALYVPIIGVAVIAVGIVIAALPTCGAGPVPSTAPLPVELPTAPPAIPVSDPPPPVVERPRLTAPLPLFGPAFATRLAGWNIADPLAWGVSEDREGFPVSGRHGEIVRALDALPGRLSVTVTVPEDAAMVMVGVRDADGRTTGLRLLPLSGIIASLVAQGPDGADLESAGAATLTSNRVALTLLFDAGRVTAVLPGAAVAQPLVLSLPAPPVAVVVSAECTSQTLFEDLIAGP